MPTMLIFGLGYTAARLADRLRAEGWTVLATRRAAHDGVIAFGDVDAVRRAIAAATHILSSVPPGDGGDPVLDAYAAYFGDRWLGYLSSTGVYGDAGGAWVDEGMATGTGRNAARADADARWLAAGARVFRLPGIYGPGRSAIERVRNGKAHRVDRPGQVFSRIHVDDIVAGVAAAIDGAGPAGAYNLADDRPSSQNAVVAEACRLAGVALPPLRAIDDAGLSPMARGFYAENRRVANRKARRLLGWRPRFADYRAGLADCLERSATTSPPTTSTPPATADADQR